ncbi:MAG TPA: hybrid sensor histidine kinase/response regulator [Polyangiaceae bacterium]
MMKKNSMRLLLVDDDEDAAGVVVERLRAAGRDVQALRVDSCEELGQALGQEWNAVLCNDTMPGFDAATVLGLVQELTRDLPLIILTGAVGEEAAVDYMRLGARDVVLRGNLRRLLPALDREIAESKVRAQLRRSEDLLLRSQRLRAMGEMAAGVAHDVRNLLNPIHLNVQLAERACTPQTPDTIPRALTDIRRLVMRAVQTVERLRDYSRPAEATPHMCTVDLNALVTEACDVARPRVASRGIPCRIIEELGSPPPTKGFPGEIVSALVNLILNAIDAMPNGGSITLRTGEHGGAFISVGDDGPGMPPEVAAHVFEPFFTTKGDRGTGLGLATVSACMELHAGHIALQTTEGQGTTFTLSFPRATISSPCPGLASTQPSGDARARAPAVG